MELNKIYCMDAIEGLKQLADNSVDLIVTDPPYALGSEVIIRPDGKPDYSKAVDFMQKWSQPDGNFWEEWFKEAFRVLKFGGRIAMFGMDRQLLVNKYYSVVAGFEEQQSIYWYFISNFPKASDLSKNMMKYFGDEGEETGEVKKHAQKGVAVAEERGAIGGGAFGEAREEKITTPTHPLAKKYEGYKYSISPLKQTCETIMIFLKPQKTGSTLHDTLAMENGDDTITCSALDIDGNRIPINENIENDKRIGTKAVRGEKNGLSNNNSLFGGNEGINKIGVQMYKEGGRYPAQTFIDEGVAVLLDKQSGISPSSSRPNTENLDYGLRNDNFKFTKNIKNVGGFDDIGGCSKILHKCKYDKQDFDLFFYCPKVDSSERNQCMEGEEDKKGGSRNASGRVIGGSRSLNGDAYFDILMKNNHPTVKPLSLMTHILKLFKTPNKQLIVDTFAGSGSTLISAKHLGFDWLGFEINEDYVKIAKKRMSQSTMFDFQEDKENVL